MTKARLLIATLAVASLAGFGCGGDDDDEGTTSAEETTTEATSLVRRVDLVTPPGEELVFKPDSATATAGPVTVVWDNESRLLHSFCLEDPQGRGVDPPRGGVCSNAIKATSEMSFNITSVYPNLKPGEYTFYCGVDEHREQGMEGTLTIE